MFSLRVLVPGPSGWWYWKRSKVIGRRRRDFYIARAVGKRVVSKGSEICVYGVGAKLTRLLASGSARGLADGYLNTRYALFVFVFYLKNQNLPFRARITNCLESPPFS